MKIILQNKNHLRFTNIYLFKNGKCIQILDNINYIKTVEQILGIDQTIEYAIVDLPKRAARLNIINSLNNRNNNLKFFLYDNIPLRLNHIAITRKPDGGPLFCVGRAPETEVGIMNTMLNEIESKTEEE